MLEIIDLKIRIENFAKETQSEFPNKYFDYAGIIPVHQNWDRYECTPINVETFAHTGGDGVHFSLLNLSSDIKPVVMTVPCFGEEYHKNNLILSENLIEFLSLEYL